MFELSVAWKYLAPRWRQLSVSIISLISILVIALVVWLIVVFFSVTHGLERIWIQKLIALTAPIRITPTEYYYNSYYYQIDSVSEASNYNTKTIGEKLKATTTNPYDPERDMEVPLTIPQPTYDAAGQPLDPVKEAFQILQSLPHVTANDFEMAGSNLRLRLIREEAPKQFNQTFLTQPIYLSSLQDNAQHVDKMLLPLTDKDLDNILKMMNVASDNITENMPQAVLQLDATAWKAKLEKWQEIVAASKSTQVLHLPSDLDAGEGILLPKSFRNADVRAGDRGYLSYYAPTASAVQEQRLPIYVAGFYDPGMIPLGGKFVLTRSDVVNQIRSSHQQDNATFSNGINVQFHDLSKARSIKQTIEKAFEKAGIAPYWHVETYEEYDFSRDLVQQLQSDRHLWTLIASVIILVACSNIISMLIILVNDKKLEIGILRAMGASSLSIALIFGICGMAIGLVGSILGAMAAMLTLRHLQGLIEFISYMQGHEIFNPLFYGSALPNEMSVDALLFVVIATTLSSLLAGIIPAIKAGMMRPAAILRSE